MIGISQKIMNKKTTIKTIIVSLITLCSLISAASLQAECTTGQCCGVFPDAVQENTGAGSIILTGCRARISSATVLTPALTATLPGSPVTACGATTTCSTNHGLTGCTARACQPTGGTITLPTFPASFACNAGTIPGGDCTPTNVTLSPSGIGNSYTTVLANNGTVTLGGSGIYKINLLRVQRGSGGTTTLNIAAGNDYYINKLDFITTAANRILNIVVTGSGTARLFVNTDNGGSTFTISETGTINVNTGGTANQLLIAGYTNTTINANLFQMKGMIYVNPPNTLTVLSTNPAIPLTGAASAQTVTLGSATRDANIVFDGPSLSLLTDDNFGGSAATCIATYSRSNTLSVTGVPATGTNCAALGPIQVLVNGAGGTPDTGYRGTITLDTNNGGCPSPNCVGTWTKTQGNGTFTSTTGSATYTFLGTEGTTSPAPQFTLSYPGDGLASPVIRVTASSGCFATNVVNNTVNFNPTGYAVTSIAVPTNGAIPAAYNTNQTAGNNTTPFTPSVNITAINGSCAGVNNVNTAYTGSKTVKICTNYINPAAPLTPTIVKLGGGTSTCSAGSILNFSSGTVAVSNLSYTDVGSLSFTATDTAAGGPAGTSGTVVVKPASFAITSFTPANPGASNSSGAVIARAGQPITLVVEARTSQGAVTPNYNNESTPQGLAFAANLVDPVGGVTGTMTITTPFTGTGTLTGAVSYSEVGVITLNTSVGTGSYLGAGNVTTTSSNIGRFTPDHYNVVTTGSPAQFTAACTSGGFTYLGQTLGLSTSPSLTVTAQNSSNVVTQNYRAGYVKLTAALLGGTNQFYVAKAGQPLLVNGTYNSPTTFTPDNLGNVAVGGFSTNFTPSGALSYTHDPAVDVSPFNAAMQFQLTVTDSDSIFYGTGNGTSVPTTSNPFTIGVISGAGTGIPFSNSSQMYQGRLVVNNASGSEIVPLTIPMQAQYYSGTGAGYVVNTSDNCTQLNSTVNVLLTNPPSGGVATSASFATTPLIFSGGLANFTLSAPGVTGQKNIEIDLSATGENRTWLQYNWPFTAGVGLENPRAQANFGFYPGASPKIIYQRQNFP